MHVPPTELRRIWPEVRDRVADIARLDGDAWLQEDVYRELCAGGTHLFTTPDFSGFVVAQILVSPYSRNLHVWAASNSGGGDRGDFIEQLKSIAAENACDQVTFVSDRTGWKRAFPEARATTLYSIRVGD